MKTMKPSSDATLRPHEVKAAIREIRPFFMIMIGVLVAMYAWALMEKPTLRSPALLIPFTLLVIIHGALHWYSLRIAFYRRWIIPYLIIQGLLLFVINHLAGNQGMLIGLYLAMIGATVGIIDNLRLSLIPLVGYLGLALVNVGLTWGWDTIPSLLTFFLPMTFFVVVYVMMFDRQAKARQHSQRLLEELETAHRQLTEYAAQVEDLTLTTERQRMARELHDTLAQGLAGLILQLEAADSRLLHAEPEMAREIVQQAMERARATLTDARQAIQDLRSEDSPTKELSEIVREEVDRFKQATGIPCHLVLSLPNQISTSIKENAQRAVAEGLTNVARHAQASQVWLSLKEKEGMLEVCIRDNGIGFETSNSMDIAGHYGLIGLRERTRLAKGKFDVTSVSGEGTTLTIHLPLDEFGGEE
jgi:NarL family two-component system sensor histidine kinase YdfH